jgi:hypothetical protein
LDAGTWWESSRFHFASCKYRKENLREEQLSFLSFGGSFLLTFCAPVKM